MKPGVKDTAAYRVIREMVDHTWGSEVELSDKDVLGICRSYASLGGSWESLLGGDMRCVTLLELSIDELVAPRQISTASRGAE